MIECVGDNREAGFLFGELNGLFIFPALVLASTNFSTAPRSLGEFCHALISEHEML